MTEYLHTYNVVIDPEQGTRQPDGSWAHPPAGRLMGPRRLTLVLVDAPGPACRRPVAITLTPERARELGSGLLATAEHAQRTTTTPQPKGDDQ